MTDFLAELKRRNVIRLAGLYVESAVRVDFRARCGSDPCGATGESRL
jgi:hypothetical protein